MITMTSNKLARNFSLLGKISAAVVFLLGAAVFIGWIFDISHLIRISSHWIAMKPNTAIAFMLASIAITLSYYAQPQSRLESTAQLCSFVVLLIGGVTLTEHLTGLDFGIDYLFFTEPMHAITAPVPGRMLPVTAFNFILIGLTTWLIPMPSRYAWHRYLIAVVILTSGFALLTYLYSALETPAVYTRVMTLHTAIAFLFISLAIWLACPEKGLVKILLNNSIGGYLLRRILPTAIVLPILVSIVHLLSQHHGLYALEYSMAFFVLLIITAFIIVLWLVIYRLDSIDVVKQHLEEQVQERTNQLEIVNKELESFSYSVSHDLRAPLRAIDGFSQALEEDYQTQLDTQAKDYLRYVRTGVKRMGQLIDDILQLSRVTRAELMKEATNLSEIADEINLFLQKSNPQRAIKINITPSLIAHGDPRLLRIALENLFDNAWKFTSKTTAAQIDFSADMRDGNTIYFVRDNGAGFDMKYVHKLFQAFQRLHSATDFPGDGIGLATVAKIIHKHGGNIWAESKLNEETTFFFTL